MKRIPKLLMTGVLYLFLFTIIPQQLRAKTNGDSLSLEMKHFFDSIAPVQLKQVHMPGLVIVVINNDSILFAKGYGYANLQKNITADPEKTVWRLASISKVVTATAVMQLVEQGKLDLDKDVNDYLKVVKVPEKFSKPVTLKNLLTHTAGFDDKYIGKSFRSKAELLSLQDFLKKMLPKRIYPPGKIYLYSNIGIALAALVVQDVSGEDFNEYCRRHIFRPLGMNETSFRLDKTLKENLYQGYLYLGGNFKAVPFDFLGDYPAGQLLSTADEFARFMMCQLNDGELNGVRILKAKTAEMMHSTQFTQNPKLNGSIGLAFNIFSVDGNKIVAHNGGYLGLATRMWLLPGRKTGLFMATNIMNMNGIENISYAFVKRFFDNTPTQKTKYPLVTLPAYDPNVGKYTGYYRYIRYAHHEITKMGLLWGFGGGVVHIWKNDSGMLMMNNFYGQPRRLIQVRPGVFRSVDDDYHIAFKLNKKGNPEFLFTAGTAVFEKVPEFYTARVQRILLGGLLGFFMLILLFRLIYRFLPSRIRSRNTLPALSRKIRKTSTWTSGLFLIHWLGLGLVFYVLHPPYELMIGFGYGFGIDMYIVQSILFIAMVPLLFTMIYYFRILGNKEITLKSKLFYTVFILASIFYLWLLYYWNILGFWF